MTRITCYECNGKRWVVEYGMHGLPEQEKCECCDGEGTIMVTDEFAKGIEGEAK